MVIMQWIMLPLLMDVGVPVPVYVQELAVQDVQDARVLVLEVAVIHVAELVKAVALTHVKLLALPLVKILVQMVVIQLVLNLV